jgi:DNA polymerase I
LNTRYGAGNEKIGSIIGKDKIAGGKIKAKFLKKLTALKKLIDDVKSEAQANGYLVGLDDRTLKVRSQHAALNVLLQSAGALICKLWIVLIEEELIRRGYKHGWDGDYAYCAWVHDEVQIACRQEIAEEVGLICREQIKEVEKTFQFKWPLRR